MSPETVEAAERACERAVRAIQAASFSRRSAIAGRNSLIDPSDLYSEGLCHTLDPKTIARFNPARVAHQGTAGLEAYLYRVARIRMGIYVSRTLAVPSVPADYTEGAKLQERAQHVYVQETGAIPPALTEATTPEDRAIEKESAQRLDAWRIRARYAIACLLKPLTARERRAAERLFGLDGLPPEKNRNRVAAHAGISVTAVYVLMKRLRRKAAKLRALHAQAREIRETTFA